MLPLWSDIPPLLIGALARNQMSRRLGSEELGRLCPVLWVIRGVREVRDRPRRPHERLGRRALRR
jgi:hypothetical protein